MSLYPLYFRDDLLTTCITLQCYRTYRWTSRQSVQVGLLQYVPILPSLPRRDAHPSLPSAFACFAEVYIGYVLLGPARISAARLGPEWGAAYRNSAILLSALWLLSVSLLSLHLPARILTK